MNISIGEVLNSPVVLLFLKFATILIMAIYVIFALMIVRQVQLMNQSLRTPVSVVIKMMSFLHLILAIGIIVFAWMML